MSIFVCCGRDFSATNWARMKFRTINEETARKRIPVHYIYSRAELETYREEYESDPSTLVLMSTTNEGIAAYLEEFRGMPLFTVVFSNHDYPLGDGEYSTVMTDMYGTTKSAVDALRAVGCRRIALFGIDRKGGQDRLREAAFRRACGEDAIVIGADHPPKPFKNSFRLLLKQTEPIDGLLVAYDYQAFRLVKALGLLDPAWQTKLRLIAFGGMPLGEMMTPTLSSVTLGFVEGATEVVSLHRMYHKSPSLASVHLKIRGKVIARETTAGDPPTGMVFAPYAPETERILEETQWTVNAMNLETLITLGDPIDAKIMLGVMRGESLEKQAEKLYLSEGAIKYRIRGFRKTVGVDTTEELRHLLLLCFDEKRIAALADAGEP